MYPAAYDGVIAVSAATREGLKSNFTNYDNKNIYAPGESINTTSSQRQSNQDAFSGSSAAAPIISSICSFLLTKFPFLSPGQIEDILFKSAKVNYSENISIRIVDTKKAIELCEVWY